MPHSNTINITVEWGDCDPAGIVFYPNYFVWFDDCTQALLRSVDLDQRRLRERFQVVGTPLVEASASFRAPASYGDVLQASSRVAEWGRKSFQVSHRLSRDGELIVEGREVRVWGAEDPEQPGRIRALPIPEAFVALFQGGEDKPGA